MIMILSPVLYSRIGAALSALIIVFGAIGLTLHNDVYAHIRRRDFYCYYTNLSNLLVLIYFGAGAPLLYARGSSLIPLIEFSVTMSILLTHLVFHFLIFPEIRPLVSFARACRATRIMASDNFIIHYLVPWMTAAYWLLCAPGKQAIPFYAGLSWMIFPFLYIAGIFLRARTGKCIADTDSPYPYAFLDVRRFGYRRVASTCAALFASFALLSFGIWGCMQLLFAVLGSGHALILI